MLKNLNIINEKHNFSYLKVFNNSIFRFKSAINVEVKKIDFINELLLCIDHDSFVLGFSFYEMKHILN